MSILNLACGTKTSDRAGVVNIDWSPMLRIRNSMPMRALAPLLLHGNRLVRFRSLPRNIMIHDLSNGIPFADGSVDMCYCSHFLEHLDRTVAPSFLCECQRVLKVGGVIRIVVPDYEQTCAEYMSNVRLCESGDAEALGEHDQFIERMLEQSVRREAYGTSQQKPARRMLENLILGDARKRGETHQWMYDRFNLSALLMSVGFMNPEVKTFNTSAIDGWDDIGLDRNAHGTEYKPNSLYMEASKPFL